MGRPLPALTQEAAEKLRTYPFPGNVRELENVLERALIYREDGAITPGDIDLPGAAGAAPPTLSSLETIEREAIRKALARANGNRTRAAAELGVSRKTIINKIKAYGFDS
jgi:two-component system response regulator AtoC